jgi:hypothetical protein
MAQKYRDYAPALYHGAKIYPEDLAGMLGLASVGNIWYVDPGKSVSGGGTSRSDAFITVLEAYNAATANNDDVVLITPSSATGRTSEAASITWNKRRTHLIGATSPLSSNSRAGMSFTSAATTPSMTISTRSCIFKNITIAQFNDVNVLVTMSGSYNYFENVHFAGMGNATTGDDTAGRCLVLNGSDENTFNSCTFGLDTVVRTGANYTLEFAGSKNNSNNVFNNCIFTMIADADAPRHILASASGVNRFSLFNHCFFFCNSDVTSGTTQTDCFNTDSAGNQGGVLILKDCMQVGHTGWADDVTGVKILGAITNDTELTDYSTGVNPAA